MGYVLHSHLQVSFLFLQGLKALYELNVSTIQLIELQMVVLISLANLGP